MHYSINPSALAGAAVSVPGDKSISHRAVMLGAIANGTTTVAGFLDGEDCLATLAAMQALGVSVERPGATDVIVHGVGLRGLEAASHDLDLGNSGTAMRLMCGLLCGQSFDSRLVGDESLSRRPMDRVITPLTGMGAAIDSADGCPPLAIHGGHRLRGVHYDMPVASAQVKSALLLAGLYADGETSVAEPAVTRDHTERMLATMGARVVTDGNKRAVQGGSELKGTEVRVPGDLSSAAFVILAAVLSNAGDVLIRNVGVNPTRTGVIDILRAMGAAITLEHERQFGAEPVADIRVRASALQGIDVNPALVSLAIDEFPVLFVAAAAAHGTTRFDGIGELRVKESDRIAAMAAGLRSLGITVDESPDGAVVHGGRFGAGTVDSCGDHRIAMSLAVAASVAEGTVTVRNVENVTTSFPAFSELMESLGLDIMVNAA